jgi:hypothetical protein
MLHSAKHWLKASLDGNAKQIYLYGGLPYISGQTTFTGRTVQRADNQQPQLTIGSNVDVG